MSDSHKSWIFTHNNWTEEDKDRFLNWEKNYLCLGEEIGENGTPHLQGFIIFGRNYRLTQLKKLSPKTHWESAISSDAMNYCMKEKYTIQDNRKQGKRNDLEDAIKTLREKGLSTVRQEHAAVYVKYHSGLEKLLDQTPRYFKPEVVWIYGPTGTGKTKWAFEHYGSDIWTSGNDLRWWNGYENQETVLLDDFRGDFCKFHTLLRILDRYPYTVEVKGGHRELNSKNIIITSAYHPKEVYNTREDIDQLLRRIDSIKFFEFFET